MDFWLGKTFFPIAGSLWAYFKHSYAYSRKPEESSKALKKMVAGCQALQIKRAGKVNAHMTQGDIREHCTLQEEDELLLASAMDRLKLSIRSYFRILKIARTIADLELAEAIQKAHLLEAINYGSFDRPL